MPINIYQNPQLNLHMFYPLDQEKNDSLDILYLVLTNCVVQPREAFGVSKRGYFFWKSTFGIAKKWIYLYKHWDHDVGMYIKHLAGTETEILLFLLSFVNFSVNTTSFGIYLIDLQEETAFLWLIQWEEANSQTLKFSNKKCYQCLAWRLLLHSEVEKPLKYIRC